MKNIFIIIGLATLLVGCASSGQNYDSRKVSQIVKGKTTEPELVQMFGKPEERGINSDGQATIKWFYTEATTKGTTFIPVVGLFAGGADTKTKSLEVDLTNGVVCSYSYSGGGFDVSEGTKSDPEDTNAPVGSLKPPRSN